jgi:PAS domain S-box-containing protein
LFIILTLQKGNVLAINEDAYMLLGQEPEEVIGRNIKYIQPPEVSEQHDMYLARYKETGVARVVGIARSVDSMHRDGTYFATEIQVTEQVAADGSKSFIGRLRHRKIEQRVEKDLITRYIVNTKNLGSALSSMTGNQSANQSSVSMSSDKKIKFKGKKGSNKGSHIVGSSGLHQAQGTASIHNDTEEHSILSNSLNSSQSGSSKGGSSSLSSNTKFLTLLSKLKDIKNSAKEDPSSTVMARVLNILFVVYVVFCIIGIIVSNLLPNPIPYYQLLNVILDTDMVINQVLTAATVLYIDNNPTAVTSYCAWTPSAVKPGTPLCPWIDAALKARAGLGDIDSLNELYVKVPDDFRTQHPVRNMLPIYSAEVKTVTRRLEERYGKIRKPGDVFDQIIQGDFVLYQFVNGSVSYPTNISVSTLWNVLGSVNDAISVLSNQREITDDSKRAWQFLLANRYRITDIFIELARIIPGQATASIQNNIVFHFVMAALSVVLGIVFYTFLLIPRIRQIQLDREKILRLLLLVPKEIVHDLVYRVYTIQDDDDNDDKKEEEKDSEDGSDEEGSLADGDGADTQDVAIIADRGAKYVLGYGLGLGSITIPIIFFAIFGFARAAWFFMMVGLLDNLTILYHDMETISFQIFPGSYKCTDATFCYPDISKGINRFLYNVDEVLIFRNLLTAIGIDNTAIIDGKSV